jgi:hypothetical protein
MIDIWYRYEDHAGHSREVHQNDARVVWIPYGLQRYSGRYNKRALIVMCPAAPGISRVMHQVAHLGCEMRSRLVEVGLLVLHRSRLQNDTERFCTSFRGKRVELVTPGARGAAVTDEDERCGGQATLGFLAIGK